ncbi:hypothetical protein [Grapevine Roditis leaf discoloration-associated virus]|uniref:Uncharacterized protein n=1 Tax=Grapevine Roditis leaf discoloration-associated virus TaxID=1471299 RepID=A0A0F7TDF1_9VIRU|nr:hypothetical protein [Grapevine Roditis leaf discoloration-associated virus]CEG62475.1 hypothetical protein [Grapevine Roditis leaf discoloration-associated virus]
MEPVKGAINDGARGADEGGAVQRKIAIPDQQDDRLFQQYKDLSNERRTLHHEGISFTNEQEIRKQLGIIEAESAKKAIKALEEYQRIHAIKTLECQSWSSPGRDGNYWSDHFPNVKRSDENLKRILHDLREELSDALKFSI